MEKNLSSAKPAIRCIAITGPESTGKSELAQQLATYYGTVWVPEFARNYLNNLKRAYVKDDLLVIAMNQLHSMETAFKSLQHCQLSNPDKPPVYLFYDTELLVLKIWSEVKYGECHPWITENLQRQQVDFYLLMNIDLPWVDDPLREHPHMRPQLLEMYRNELIIRRWPYRHISGSGEQRFLNAIQAIETFYEQS